ncbi:uncharacterized protein LOC128635358 [Ictalurus punctatus]|uniref:Uncharacterized protein LOC128635358 n=1 Tax=Ictalurus punctatus TaxID=7998 RepID=A0A9F7RVL4_ICTPU|nr:uncharacterized protein LOC128635358 [Ictalurus punctatus]
MIATLEVCIQTLERVSESESSEVSVGESLDASGRDNNPPTPVLKRAQRGEWVTTQGHNCKAKANAKACPQEQHSALLHISNRFALLSEAPTEKPERALVIGYSVLKHVKLARPLREALVTGILGARAPNIAGNLRVLGKHWFSKIVIHVGANDIPLRQSEVTKNSIVEVCKLAKAMSDAVICSGPIPMQCGDVAYSRLWSLNCWMSRWCSKHNVGFIDICSSLEGKVGLLGWDPTREGAALISCSIAHSLRPS